MGPFTQRTTSTTLQQWMKSSRQEEHEEQEESPGVSLVLRHHRRINCHLGLKNEGGWKGEGGDLGRTIGPRSEISKIEGREGVGR